MARSDRHYGLSFRESGTDRVILRCRSHASPQPEENADIAAIRWRSPELQHVGHLQQNAIRIIDISVADVDSITQFLRTKASVYGLPVRLLNSSGTTLLNVPLIRLDLT